MNLQIFDMFVKLFFQIVRNMFDSNFWFQHVKNLRHRFDANIDPFWPKMNRDARHHSDLPRRGTSRMPPGIPSIAIQGHQMSPVDKAGSGCFRHLLRCPKRALPKIDRKMPKNDPFWPKISPIDSARRAASIPHTP